MKVGPFEVPGFYQGDARELLRQLPDESVQCVVTSPPYWGLRVYAGDQAVPWLDGSLCPFGNEQTPEEYVEHTVEVLREIRRVLRDDGVCFWNVGDSFYSNASNQQGNVGQGQRYGSEAARHNKAIPHRTLKQKDLVLIPHRVALAAQADGWFIRSDIIWSKPNPMPESVTDRPTSAHEHIIMMTKLAKYFWDADAVREPHQMRPQRRPDGHKRRRPGPLMPEHTWSGTARTEPGIDGHPAGRNTRDVWSIPTQPYKGAHFAVFPSKLPATCIRAASKPTDLVLDPFCGSGTTCAAAEELGRLWLGFDISEDYRKLQKERTAQTSMVGALEGGKGS